MPAVTYRSENMRTIRNAKAAAKRKIKEVKNKYQDDSASSSDDTETEYDSSSPGENSRRQTIIHRHKRNRISSDDEEENNVNEEPEYYVECIRDTTIKDDKRFFLVKWLDWPEDHNTWEPLENMTGCHDMINEFLKQKESRVCKAKELNKLKVRSLDVKPNLKQLENEIQKLKHAETSVKNLTLPVRKLENLKKEHNTKKKALESKSSNNHIFIFKIWVHEQVQFLYLDVKETKEEFYSVVLTEDLQGKEPKWLYGATEGVDGSKYFLVQFEGSDLVEVVPPVTLIEKFPYVKKFYDHLENSSPKKVA